jgi:hypothetical protein
MVIMHCLQETVAEGHCCMPAYAVLESKTQLQPATAAAVLVFNALLLYVTNVFLKNPLLLGATVNYALLLHTCICSALPNAAAVPETTRGSC